MSRHSSPRFRGIVGKFVGPLLGFLRGRTVVTLGLVDIEILDYGHGGYLFLIFILDWVWRLRFGPCIFRFIFIFIVEN